MTNTPQNSEKPDCYQVLGVLPSATQDEIVAVYKKRIQFLASPKMKNKPIEGGLSLEEKISQLTEAYQTLADAEKRLAYNKTIQAGPASLPATPPNAVVRPLQYREMEQAVQKKKQSSIYKDYYGFAEKPFNLTPDPKYLYLSSKHKEVLAHLVFGLQENNGFLKIIGEVGTGKTTICRSFLRELNADFNFAYIFHPCANALEMLQSISAELGLPASSRSKKDLVHQLHRYLLRERQRGHRVAVIIDEAQDLDAPVLEELRLLSNLETETEKLIQIILIGQPELDDLLNRPNLRQLRQRITIQWELLPLNLEETRGYIQHRLNVAGGKGKVMFSRPATELIFRYAQGIPRMINVLADRALLIAYTRNTKKITPREVRLAVKDFGGLSVKSSRTFWKVLASALALVVAAIFIFEAPLDFKWSRSGGMVMDLKQLIQQNPIDLSDPGELIPQAKPPVLPSAGRTEKPGALAPGVPAVSAEAGTLRISRTEKLVAYLAGMSSSQSKIEAAKWILKSWGMLPQNLALVNEASLADLKGEFDLSALTVTGGWHRLRGLNYPAILEITLPDTDSTMYLSLIALKEDFGIFGSVDKLEIPLAIVEPLWHQQATVLWQDFENIPDVLKAGYRGRETVWLQKNLRLLGFFKGPNAPHYGSQTAAAVRLFQRQYNIKEDGRFGVETQAMLYNLLSIYPTPQLIGP